MRQTELGFQALRAGFTDLLSRFNVCDSNFKGRILLSQSSLNINRSPTLPNLRKTLLLSPLNEFHSNKSEYQI